jgi:radical SAM superfamily enzyme YgiQ (UPF0313 family)
LVHDFIGAATYMFPLNIGYLAAYLKEEFGDAVDVRLFKFPENLLRAVDNETPAIVGFSHYVWNADLNAKVAQRVKARSPGTLMVFGGPNIDYTDFGIKRFFNAAKVADAFIPYQGETPFNHLVREYLTHDCDGGALTAQPLDGSFLYDRDSDTVLKGDVPPRIKHPDQIPSPYLTGILDEFFETNLIPIIETNRGCPFQCTFCAQGMASLNKINYFSLERVHDEMEYVARHVKTTNLLHFADSNFGIVDRDIEIAEHTVQMRNTLGFPRKVSSNMAKNRPPDKMIRIAELLGDTALVVSLQSLDDKVLERIKRRNIRTSFFKEIIHNVNEMDGISGTEIILGLPGETADSHLETIRQLFDMDVSYIIAYNGLILEGTELSAQKDSGEFQCKTKFRLIDSSFGEYFVPLPQAHNVSGIYDENIVSFECEEGILETDTMSQDEILYFRPVHWLIQFMWNYRFYYDFLKFMQNLGVNPVDYIIKLIELAPSSGLRLVQAIFDDFTREALGEWFDSPAALRKHYSQPEHLSQLKQGLHGKMNGKYIFRVLVELKRDFEQFMLAGLDHFPALKANKAVFTELLNFLGASIIDLEVDLKDLERVKSSSFEYDFMQWRQDKFCADNTDVYRYGDVDYTFRLSDDTVASLDKLLTQYQHSNKNVTLRKMSEYMPIKDLFYEVSTGKQQFDATDAANLIAIQEGRMGVAE